ncbi:MAG: hypothetical protein U9R75_04930 [Candidatus Thermoplasmatota archaeon]|nr:hypothetical protein [Candidatus Thermoplasmatota archaeon]
MNDRGSFGSKKFFAISAVLILLIVGIIVFKGIVQNDTEREDLDIGDVLNQTSVRKGMPYNVINADGNFRYSTVVATPVACHYDISRGTSGLLPLLIKGDEGASRFEDMTGRGTPLLISIPDDPLQAFMKSADIARTVFVRSSGIMLVPNCDIGYELSLAAAPMASYLNIPIVVISSRTDPYDLEALADDLSSDYLMTIGEHASLIAKGMDIDRVPLPDMESVWNASARVVQDRFGRLDYITMTNPGDTVSPDILDVEVTSLEQNVNSVLLDTSSKDIDLVGESVKVHPIDVPDGIVDLRIYVNFSDLEGHPLDPLKTAIGVEPMSFITLIDPQGRIAASAPSFSASTGKNYAETIVVDNPGTYWLEVKVYYGVKGLSTMGGTSFGISRISGSYNVETHSAVLGSPHVPYFEGSSTMAPYLSASRGGMVLSSGSFSLLDEEYIEKADGHSTGPWYDSGLLHVAREKVDRNVQFLSDMIEMLPPELKDTYLSDRGWLALLGGGNMLPMYYEDKDPSWEENPVWGVGWATDVPYSLDLNLSVGRPLGRSLSDISALIARTLFYREYTESFVKVSEERYGSSGSFLDHFHFLAGEGGGRTGWLFHQREFSGVAESHGFTSEVYMQDYENDRQTLVEKGAFERANYFEMILHGDWSWFSPELNGFDRYSTGVKVTDLMENSFDWELGPSVFNSGVCLLGRLGGLRPEQSITQAFFASGINAFFCATRSTGSEAKAGPIEEALLFDDLSVGEAIRKDKRENPAVPTFYVRTLYGDPAFNPYEPENGFAGQGRPVMLKDLSMELRSVQLIPSSIPRGGIE